MAEVRLLQSIVARLKFIEIDATEYACLKAVVLFKPGESTNPHVKINSGKTAKLLSSHPLWVHAVPHFIKARSLPLNFIYFERICHIIHDIYNKTAPNNLIIIFILTKKWITSLQNKSNLKSVFLYRNPNNRKEKAFLSLCWIKNLEWPSSISKEPKQISV